MSNIIDPTALEAEGGHRGRRALLIVAAVLAAIALVLVGGSYAYAQQYDGKALPGTTVLGQDVSGRTAAEIEKLITDKASAVKVSVTAGDQTCEASLADLGVTVDAKATAAKATAHDGNVVGIVRSTFDGGRSVGPVVTVDRAASEAFAASLVPDDRTAPADAQVVYDDASKAWTVVPGHAGQGVDASALAATVSQKAPALQPFSIDLPVSETQPALTDAMAQSTVDSLTASLQQPVSVSGPDGKAFEASAETRSSWITVEPTATRDGFSVTVDKASVSEWVTAKAKKSSVEPVDGIEQVDASGATVKVLTEKKDGTQVSNADAVTEQVVTGMTQGQPVAAKFETTPLAATVKKAQAPAPADPAAAVAAPAAPAAEPTGEKWIDVNLSDKTVTAYVGSTPVRGPVSVVIGKDNRTRTGTFKIWHRTEKQDMTNGTRGVKPSDPDYYYTKDVPWVQYFDGNIAFHGAPWRKSFGFAGSHGCINMPVPEAKWLYNWAGMGTKVVVHN